jgi:hypothetical protein
MCIAFTDTLPRLNHRQHKVKPAFTSLEPSVAYRAAMDMQFNPEFSRAFESQDCFGATPDWQEMRARLEAARLARRALGALTVRSGQAGASFDQGAARTVAAFRQASLPVNPTALGNRKPSEDIDACVAGASLTGGRGI